MANKTIEMGQSRNTITIDVPFQVASMETASQLFQRINDHSEWFTPPGTKSKPIRRSTFYLWRNALIEAELIDPDSGSSRKPDEGRSITKSFYTDDDCTLMISYGILVSIYRNSKAATAILDDFTRKNQEILGNGEVFIKKLREQHKFSGTG